VDGPDGVVCFSARIGFQIRFQDIRRRTSDSLPTIFVDMPAFDYQGGRERNLCPAVNPDQKPLVKADMETFPWPVFPGAAWAGFKFDSRHLARCRGHR